MLVDMDVGWIRNTVGSEIHEDAAGGGRQNSAGGQRRLFSP